MDGGDADGVGEAEKLLACRADELQIGNSLKFGVLDGRHPAHSDVSVCDLHNDLASAAAARRSQATGYSVEANFQPLMAAANSAKGAADEGLLLLAKLFEAFAM